MRWYAFMMYLLPAISVIVGVLYRESFDLYHYIPEEPKPNISHLTFEANLKESPLTIVFFEPNRPSDKREALIGGLLELNSTINIIVTPCDAYLEREYGCYEHSYGFIFLFKYGKRIDNNYNTAINYKDDRLTAEQLMRYIDKVTQNYDVFATREALENQIWKQKQLNLTTIVQFSQDCSKWTHGLFVSTIEVDFSRDDTIRVALVRNESLIQEYTNDTKDSFMIVSPYDEEPYFSSDYVNMRLLIARYWPIFAQISKDNRDQSVALVSIKREELEEISSVMIPVARHFRGRLTFAYNVTDTPEKSLQIQMDRYRYVHNVYWYNGDLQKSADIVNWVESVLNKTEIRSQRIPRTNEKYVKVLVGYTVEKFIHQEKGVILLVKNYRWSKEEEDELIPILNKFETVAKENEGLSIGIIDRFRNDIPSLKDVKSSRRLLTLYFPVGRKEQPTLD